MRGGKHSIYVLCYLDWKLSEFFISNELGIVLAAGQGATF